MKQKYQNACIYVGLSVLLLLLPLLLTAQSNNNTASWKPIEVQMEVERATLQELYQSNPKQLFTKGWSTLDDKISFKVCELKEVTCNKEGLIVKLDLSQKGLKVIPESIHNLERLEQLELHQNKLQELPKAIANMGHLSAITFYENHIKYLPLSLRNICGAIVRNGVKWNPVSAEISWLEFCQGH